MWAYTVIYNPALVKEPVAMRLRRVRSTRASYEMTFTVPETLRVVAGVPISAPLSFNFDVGGTKSAPRYLTWEGPCPRRGFVGYRLRLDLLHTYAQKTGSARDRGRIACRR
jgi:hypothetical protein